MNLGSRYHSALSHSSPGIWIELLTINRLSCTITEKAPTRAFSWLKAATTVDLVEAFSVIVKTDCETDGSLHSTKYGGAEMARLQ